MFHPTRRDMMKAAALAGLTMTMGRVALAEDASEKKIRVGFIGVGDRGTGLLRITLRLPNVEVPAVCDIAPAALTRAQALVEKAQGKKPEGYGDSETAYKKLLERDDLDAVVLGTPQELHAPMTIDAFAAKKFVGAEVPAC